LALRADHGTPQSPRLDEQARELPRESESFELRKATVLVDAQRFLGDYVPYARTDMPDGPALQTRINRAIDYAEELVARPDPGSRRELSEYPAEILQLVTQHVPYLELGQLQQAIPAFGEAMIKHAPTKEVLELEGELQSLERCYQAMPSMSSFGPVLVQMDKVGEKLTLSDSRRVGRDPADQLQAKRAHAAFNAAFASLVNVLSRSAVADSQDVQRIVDQLKESTEVLASRIEKPGAQFYKHPGGAYATMTKVSSMLDDQRDAVISGLLAIAARESPGNFADVCTNFAGFVQVVKDSTNG